jgi:hypothetical protein
LLVKEKEMNAADFAIDTRVVAASNHNRKGTVIGNNLKVSDLWVAVDWDDGKLERVNCNDLLTEASLEDEFKAFQAEVDGKLAEAAKLIREAANLAESRGKDLLDYDQDAEDNMFDTYQIESAMRDAGWNTSSWHC